MSRDAVARALAIAQQPRKRFREFLDAYRAGGIAAVRALDEGVARALEIEARYRRAGVKLDPKGQFERELSGAD